MDAEQAAQKLVEVAVVKLATNLHHVTKGEPSVAKLGRLAWLVILGIWSSASKMDWRRTAELMLLAPMVRTSRATFPRTPRSRVSSCVLPDSPLPMRNMSMAELRTSMPSKASGDGILEVLLIVFQVQCRLAAGGLRGLQNGEWRRGARRLWCRCRS
jgi:hypothetical protein